MIRVVIVDDHELVRRGLSDLLESDGALSVVGQAGNAYDAFHTVLTLLPEVVVLDVRLPDGNGVELCRDIKAHSPEIKVVMLTSFADDEALLGAILAGADGYILKDIKGETLLRSIHQVCSGQSILDEHAADRVRERLRKSGSPAAEISELTEQERRIIALIGQGMTNRQIAEQLFIAEKTVKNYVSSLLAKLGLERRTQAASLVTRVGLRPDLQGDLPTNPQVRL